MSNVDVGELLNGSEHRDAIHIAIAPVVAGEGLEAATPIGFRDRESHDVVVECEAAMSVGIVDPFLKKTVRPGDRFYMFLNPNTITALRHEWTHPAFGTEPDMGPKKAESERWLRDFLSNTAPSYEDLIKAVNNGGELNYSGDDYNYLRIDRDYLTVGGTDAHGSIPEEFWDHVETVVGRKLTDKPTRFSCSC